MITINSGEQLSFDFDLVDVPVLKIVEESNEKLSLENETLGYYISEFPLENIRDSLNKKRYVNTSMVNKFNNKVVRMVLMVKKNKIIKTKKNELMSITTMLDEFGSIGAVVFPSLYKRDSYLLNPGNYVIVEGKIEVKENISIVIDSISPFKFE